MPTKFKTLALGSIAAGSYAEDEWTPEKDIVIHKVMANEQTGAALNAAQLYITIADEVYTKTYVPLSVIGTSPEYAWKPELKVPKGARIYVKVYNAGSSAVNVELVFEYE